MIKYSNGLTYKKSNIKVSGNKVAFSLSSANRGMNLEEDIIQSNEYYLRHKMALIYKRPTPIQVVKVEYQKNVKITEAYFSEKSTTDFNGVYQGRYIDIEAKSTHSKSSFPLSNITKKQFEHLSNVIELGGLAFFIIEFVKHQKTYIVEARKIIEFKNSEERKSIPFAQFEELGREIKRGYSPRLNYLEFVDEIHRNS
ncbi:MAG: Holliday junction resolvase RecU [Bacilli bacterium]|nr:Holliday junction resolvase RecU [Bacilli bacterium]